MKCKTEKILKNQNVGIPVLEEVVLHKKHATHPGTICNHELAEIKNLMSTEKKTTDISTEKIHLEYKACNYPLHGFIKPKEKNIENHRSDLQLL